MKRLVLFIALFAILGIVNAQTIDVRVPYNVNYASYTGTAADTINGTTSVDAVFFIEIAIALC